MKIGYVAILILSLMSMMSNVNLFAMKRGLQRAIELSKAEYKRQLEDELTTIHLQIKEEEKGGAKASIRNPGEIIDKIEEYRNLSRNPEAYETIFNYILRPTTPQPIAPVLQQQEAQQLRRAIELSMQAETRRQQEPEIDLSTLEEELGSLTVNLQYLGLQRKTPEEVIEKIQQYRGLTGKHDHYSKLMEFAIGKRGVPTPPVAPPDRPTAPPRVTPPPVRPTAPAIDPEFRYVVEQHSTDPRHLDGSRFYQDPTTTQYKKETLSPNFVPLYNNRILVRQMPALIQTRWQLSEREVSDLSNYCGYYSVFAAEQLANNQDVLNRVLFSHEFPTMLAIVKNSGYQTPPGARPYENIGEEQVEVLLDRRGDSNRIAYVSNQIYTLEGVPFDTAIQFTPLPEQQVQLLKNFINGTTNNIIIVTRKGESGHYVAMNITRNAVNRAQLQMEVYDSLGGNWVSGQEEINTTLIPLYNFLNQKFK